MTGRGARVDDTGIHLPEVPLGPVDVRFGGHRVWSFNADQAGVPDRHGVLVRWPAVLAESLTGTTEVVVAAHAGGEPLYADTVVFAGSRDPLHLVDDAGNPLSLDKGMRLQRTFDEMDDGARGELVEATRQVLADLQLIGLDAYLAYGCLLGAVRDGRMIGHDSDADLAWLSRHTHPFDVIRECRAAEKALRERGWWVLRLSAANFKVWVPLPNGKRAGIDVFGSFHVGEQFHLMGSLRGPLPRSAVMPFGTVDLEGVGFPAPHDVEAFLAYTYGPGWRTPDPAFHFDHPPEHVRLMTQWFRGARAQAAYWDGFYGGSEHRRVPTDPSDFARWVAPRLAPGARVVDLGSGTGRDTIWLAEQGFDVSGADASGIAVRIARTRSRARPGQDGLVFRRINLESWGSTLPRAAQLAHRPGSKDLYARLLLEVLTPGGRDGLWRFSSMVCRGGGRSFLEFRTSANQGAATYFGPHPRTYPDPDTVVAEIAAAGGRVVARIEGRGLAVLGREDPVVCRLEVAW